MRLNRDTLGDLAFAAAFAPFIGAFLGMAVYLAFHAMTSGLSDVIGALGFILISSIYIGVIVGLPAMIVGGLPLHAAFLALNLRQVWCYGIGGIVIGGAIVHALLYAIASYPGSWNDRAPVYALGALIGLLTGLGFWHLRRPDLDPSNPPTPAS